MILSSIVAISENDVIGAKGDLPWRLSSDLRRFRELTMGHPLIMGRRTWESIGRPLPGRTSVVVTRSLTWHPEGIPEADLPSVMIAHSLDAAIDIARDIESEESFVIGGAELFRSALPLTQRIWLTRVHADVEGDVHFPREWLAPFERVSTERHEADERNEHAYSFELWERRSP